MAVFRIDKTRDYTVMANHHLRNKSLSLKAKGLLSLMLSLPEDWDYTTKGLSMICKDGVDSICSTVKELENAGYVKRRRIRDAHGRLTEVEYTILEKPEPPDNSEEPPKRENPVLDNPVLEKPVLDFPEQEKPKQGEPEQENPAQLNTKKSNTQKSITDLSNTHSFFPSESACAPAAEGMTDGFSAREKIKDQIDYDFIGNQYNQTQLDELVEIMLEVAMNRSPTIKIGRDAEYPTGFVQQRFEQITSMHIEKVLDGIRENTTRVWNTRAYLMAALFNSVSTIDNHYAMLVNHDFNGSP
ncbi:MAG: helix-turn-helix domain-containing protein [Clostridia bacterium]|nr:helix-turn-helix domain-containing protein [Clostridia bacterium]